ncbi:myb domain protein 4r1 [Phytophthora cinnamomi]|uniref:myb domain protein 4r1 n=1 Tax=Phytophthora cinnamomi TaxID=4785 RepID=UPI003559F573|nr:myb domain protein 4r1 [Phytophthora cinnamomi]
MAPHRDARAARPGSAEAIAEALAANRSLVSELQALEQSLASEEARLLSRTQSIRRHMALRRAQQAMDALLPRSRPTGGAPSCYERDPRSRRKQIGDVPRSFIRAQPSLFTDEADAPRKVGRPRKKQKQSAISATDDVELERAVLQSLTEPPPNADTEFLRARSHEAFVATPATIFSPKERKVLKDFVEDYFMTRRRGDIPLHVWNGVRAWQGTRKSRQLPIERSGFACKLWYDLHDSPTLRLGAWTKQEDAALRRLASGEDDPKLVNQWEEIAKRMPVPGRPAVHCLARYQTALRADNVKSNFTPEEDRIIKEAVPVFGEKWNVIADLLDGRVPEQIRHRWQLSLAPGLRRGKFSIIEDRRLLLALRAYVPKDGEFNLDQVAWNDICHHLPGRTQPGVRDRYATCLNPDLSFRKFTKQEDQTLKLRGAGSTSTQRDTKSVG